MTDPNKCYMQIVKNNVREYEVLGNASSSPKVKNEKYLFTKRKLDRDAGCMFPATIRLNVCH